MMTGRTPRKSSQRRIDAASYPVLAALLWDQHLFRIAADEAYTIYEMRWQYVDPQRLADSEKRFIKALIAEHGGVFLGRNFDARTLD
jgi:hypothetical protein